MTSGSASHTLPSATTSPFGWPADLVQSIPAATIAKQYRCKCDIDIAECFDGHPTIGLYACSGTGYRFWRPAGIAGNEAFYRLLSHAWQDYYRTTRWEYPHARAALRGVDRLLEVGCGRGYFLESVEGSAPYALGLELNTEAIEQRVTRFAIEPMSLDDLAARGDRFDAICAFQVLEHVTEPGAFLEAALRCLSPAGRLVLSTPDAAYQPLRDQADAFDLPPHHMGQFDKAAFRAIARQFGLEVVRLSSQPRVPVFEKPSAATRGRFAYKVARGAARALYRFAYRVCGEPGPNLLAVLRKPDAR